jgi:TRAP-type mannitol/chloroaromatic compound transport system substrate-binding protein
MGNFYKIILFVFTAMAMFASPSIAQTFKWRLVSTWPAQSTVFYSDQRFAKNIYELSGGRLQISVHPAGELVPMQAVFDTVSKGAAEMGGDWATYWSGKNSAFELLGSYPMGLSQQDIPNWYFFFGGQEIYNYMYGKYNMVYFLSQNASVGSGIRTVKPIKTLADFKGKKLRMAGKAQAYILQKLGAVQVMMPAGEIGSALAAGDIDGATFGVPLTDWSAGMGEYTKYNFAPGWNQPSSATGVMINKDAWNTLPPDLKRIIEFAAHENMIYMAARTESTAGAGINKFKEKGTQVTKISPQELKQIEEWMWEYVVEEAKKNPDYNKVATSQFQYLKDFSATRDYEHPYSQGRNPATFPKLPDLK